MRTLRYGEGAHTALMMARSIGTKFTADDILYISPTKFKTLKRVNTLFEKLEELGYIKKLQDNFWTVTGTGASTLQVLASKRGPSGLRDF